MKKTYVLFNPKAGNEEAFGNSFKKLSDSLSNANAEYLNVTEIENYDSFFAALNDEDDIYICGGDGTLNRFINDADGTDLKNDVYYYAMGTGNDFLRDIGVDPAEGPIKVNEYIKDLPVVEVKGKKYRFINNVGFGIDGYCCEVGDEMREAGNTNINYTAIAIKGLLGKFKPTNATVSVDGKQFEYKKVWIAPSMNGRYYGGGMMPTPAQKRVGEDRDISLMIWHNAGKLRTLMAFPSLFKGEHLKYSKMISIHNGKSISVRFDSPRAVQIDGETVTDVTEYTVRLESPVSSGASSERQYATTI